MRRLLWAVILASLGVLVTGVSSAEPADTEPLVTVKGPTIVAFFFPVSEREMRDNPDTNEALADFQLYAGQAREPLRKAGIDFEQLYTRSFRVRIGKSVSRFVPEEAEIGYYFVAPGKKPRVVYGVTTDEDLVSQAKEYFGPPAAK